MRSHRRSLYGVIVLGAFGASLCVLFLYSTEEAAQQRGVDGEHAFVATSEKSVGAGVPLLANTQARLEQSCGVNSPSRCSAAPAGDAHRPLLSPQVW